MKTSLFLLMCLLAPASQAADTNTLAGAVNSPTPATLKEIKVSETQFVVDGNPFFVKGISYSPFYPGESNRDEIKKANVAEDMKKMRELAVNTVLIYWLRSERIYKEARASGIMILQGIWIEQNPPDFQDSHFKEGVRRQIKHAIDYLHNLNGTDYTDTILGFWIGGEFDTASINGTDSRHPEIHEYKGQYYHTPKNAGATECFLAEMCDYGRKYARETYGHNFLFSHINWPPSDQWLRLQFLDYLLFDVYSYWPPNVASYKKGSYAPTSYQGYLEGLKKNYPNKPLIISEFGYSTAPDNPTDTGNNERDQAAGLIARWHDIVTTESPLAGGCVFEWNDEWWKQSGAASLVSREAHMNYHARDDAEEWFGIISVDGESKVKYTVRPKQAFYAVQRMFNPNFCENRRNLKPILIDQFRQGSNLFGAKWETLPPVQGGFEIRREPDNDVRTSISLMIQMDRAKADLKDQTIEYRSSLQRAGKSLDVSDQLHLSFYVRGRTDKGAFKVKLESEKSRVETADSKPWGMSDPIDKYLSKKQVQELDKDWQRVNIPLEHFGPLDLSEVTWLSLVFDDPEVKKMDLQVKDLEFSPNY